MAITPQTSAARIVSGLHYVDDQMPGITRRALKHGWAYYDAAGQRITDRDEIDRLNAVAMPPAYRDCWFCADARGHIQATGLDDRGRKQYRYHPDFRAAQDAGKYSTCTAFARALPAIRRQVETDLARRGIDKSTACAAVVRLLDLGHIRVGNRQYANENKSFGATTLRNRHVRVGRDRLMLCYRGKSGKQQTLSIENRRLATVVRRCQDLPGQQLFQYVAADGSQHPVSSHDVNDYIRDASGGDFTAKHFRTWGASVIAYDAIVAAGPAGIGLKAMLAPVAEALGNTPAISRKSYVHPALIELARAGGLKGQPPVRLPRATRWLSAAERGLTAFLDALADQTPKKAA
jgi:DNA topoisomerase-1